MKTRSTHYLSLATALVAATVLVQAPNRAAAASSSLTLAVTYPGVKSTVTNASITVLGGTKDNVLVTNVYYWINVTNAWQTATQVKGWTNWSAVVGLKPGTNVLSAYAADKSGNYSKTNTVVFLYAVPGSLEVETAIVGIASTVRPGTVTTNGHAKAFDVGIEYSLTAKANKGFAFTNWTSSTFTNPSATLSFVMPASLSVTANFKDISPPTILFVSKPDQKVSNPDFTLEGTAADNVGVIQVAYQLNGGTWTPANSGDEWTNWTAPVTLATGANVIKVYAQDGSGNRSGTNSFDVAYQVAPPPTSLSGMLGMATVEGTGGNSNKVITFCFDSSTFSASSTNGGNNVVGDFTYTMGSGGTALLTLTTTAPPKNSTNAVKEVALTFTNGQNATFFATNSDGNVSSGSVAFAAVADLAPASIGGDSAHLTDSAGQTSVVVFGGSSINYTNATGYGLGTYTYTRFSPLGGLIRIDYNKPSTYEGDIVYILPTYSSDSAGTYFQEVDEPTGTTNTDFGTFVGSK